MINDKVKEFDCCGEGWALKIRGKRRSKDSIDLSKLAWNKGYTLSFQHFGVLDPIFNNYESSTSWPEDANFVKYVLETNKLTDAWLNSEPIRRLSEGLDIEANKENFELLIESAIDANYDGFIKDVINSLGFGNDFALCGITDEDYFMDICQQIGIDLVDDDLVDVVFLG